MIKTEKPKNKTVEERLSYLSWSKLQLFEKDPNLFFQVYCEGIDMFRTKQLELGKKLAITLENGRSEDGDEMMELMAIYMPSYPEREVEINAVFENIPLKGVLDGWDKKSLAIHEVKSGKNWTQSMVDQHGQLTFYALLVWLKYKKLPDNIYLHWAKTIENDEGDLVLTGDIKTFSTKRSLTDIILFSKRIRSAWAGICALGEFNKNNEEFNY